MLINVVYDDFFDDCDIVSVPDGIGQNAEEYSQMYCKWLASDECPAKLRFYHDGYPICICETEGFVEWLNTSFGNGETIAQIVKQHTKYVPEYPSAEF